MRHSLFMDSRWRLQVVVRALATLLVLLANACKDGTGPTADVSGSWTGPGSDNSGPGSLTFVLSQDGNQVTGTFTATAAGTGISIYGSITGTVKNSEFTGSVSGSYSSCTVSATFSASVSGVGMTGMYHGNNSCTGPVTNGSFNLTRMSQPAAPSDLVAATQSASEIDLQWQDRSSDEGGFQIERASGGTTAFTPIATVGASVSGYQDVGLTAAAHYDYRVRAYNAAGPSGYSNTASATTAENFTLTVQVRGNGSVTTDPGGIDCGFDGTGRCSAQFGGGDVVLRPLAAPGWRFSGWEGFVFCAALGCGDSLVIRVASDTSVVALFTPFPGTLRVIASTSGHDIDLNGYQISVDGAVAKHIGVNDTALCDGMSPGNHSAFLTGHPDNCDVTTANPVTVPIPAGGATSITFKVSCVVWPGRLEVTTVSTGPDIDPNGYYVTLDDSLIRHIGPNTSLTFDSVRAGVHAVWLSGNPDNCDVTSANPVVDTLSPGQHNAVTFAVSCVPWYGSLKVTTVTTGRNLDPDGYSITVDDTLTNPIGVNGSVQFTSLSPGEHMVLLTGISINCRVTFGNPVRVTVPQGREAMTDFLITCN